MFKRILPLLFVVLYVLGLEEMARACSCSGGLLFDENVKHSKSVLLGQNRFQSIRRRIDEVRRDLSEEDGSSRLNRL